MLEPNIPLLQEASQMSLNGLSKFNFIFSFIVNFAK